VNITGIPNFERVKEAIRIFCETFRIQLIDRFQIDNSTASGQVERFSFKRLLGTFGKQVHYNASLFPGAFLTLSNRKTSILFKSGKYIILGCKSEEEVLTSFAALQEAIKCLQ